MKANYGIDSPIVICLLFLFGIGSFALAILVSAFLPETYPIASTLFKAQFCLVGAFLILESFFMIYSSKWGKKKIIAAIVQQLGLKGDEKVLDVGCGRGLFAIEIAKKIKTGKVTGIDKNQTERALKNAQIEQVEKRVEFVTADLCALPFSDHSFDMVASSSSVHRLKTKEERAKAVSEMSRVLKPLGKLVLIDIQDIPEYLETLEGLGWKDLQVSKRNYRIFPPIRVIIGRKQPSDTTNAH